MKKIKITEKQFIKLQEDLEYWSVSDASPSSDTYKMGVDLNEAFEDVEDYKKKFEGAYEKYPHTKIIPSILKYLDGMITIDMIVPSDKNSTTYTVYLDDVEPIEKNYCYGCSGTYHYPTGTNDLYTASHMEDNDQYVGAVHETMLEIFGGELSDWEFYDIIHKFLLDKIKKHMDNDGINAYPEEHDMDW